MHNFGAYVTYLTSLEARLVESLQDPKTLVIVFAIVTPLLFVPNFLRNRDDDGEAQEVSTSASNDSGTIMSPPPDSLEPPKSDPFTLDDLKRFDGTDTALPILVSIKGTVFDVTRKRDVYGPPSGSYRIFAGKDASKAFGLSSLKGEDCDPDWSSLGAKELKTLDEWFTFFKKRYNVVGRVTNMPEAVAKHVWNPSEA